MTLHLWSEALMAMMGLPCGTGTEHCLYPHSHVHRLVSLYRNGIGIAYDINSISLTGMVVLMRMRNASLMQKPPCAWRSKMIERPMGYSSNGMRAISATLTQNGWSKVG